jgi:cell division septal protein FtsQ
MALGAGAYVIARETSLFAISRVEVTGGPAAVNAQVVRALAPFAGTSLVGLDGGAVIRHVEALPTVVSATYDRAFPSTLSLRIVPEHPVAVLRSGRTAWLVSARGRVMQALAALAMPALPRIWMAEKSVRVGDVLAPGRGGTLTRVLAAAPLFRARISTAAVANGSLVFHLRSGLEVVLGRPADIALKVAVAAKVLAQLPPGTLRIDVSVPGRPLASPYSSSSTG